MLGHLKNLFFSRTVVDPAKFKTSMSSKLLYQSVSSLLMEFLAESQPQIAIFASGCFWGVEHIFLKHFPPSDKKGILSTTVGYTGGNPLVTNPTYKQVCSGATDHAEAVKIEFDPSILTYEQLVGG
jgi:peptide-methionine (S)-S-oxide reductase